MKTITQYIKNKFRQLDHYLLQHYPALWETKIHYISVYILGSYGLVGVLSFGWPLALNKDFPENAEISFAALSILNGLVLLWWGYKAAIYNTIRDFGQNRFWLEPLKFVSYFLGVILLGALPFMPMLILKYRFVNLASTQELLSDLKRLNEGNIYFPSHEEARGYVDNIYLANQSDELVYDRFYFGSIYIRMVDEYQEMESDFLDWKKGPQLLQDAQKKKAAFRRISRFFDTYQKYADFPVSNQPDESDWYNQDFLNGIYIAFLNEKTALSGTLVDKVLAKNRIETIISGKRSLFDTGEVRQYKREVFKLVIISFVLVMFFQMGKYLGGKRFILATLSVLGVSYAFMNLAYITLSVTVSEVFVLVLASLALILTLRIKKARSYKNIYMLALIFLQFLTPLVLVFAPVLIDEIYTTDEEKLYLLFAGMVMYVLLLPAFRKLHGKLRALPSRV